MKATDYWDYSGRYDLLSGVVKLVLSTLHGTPVSASLHPARPAYAPRYAAGTGDSRFTAHKSEDVHPDARTKRARFMRKVDQLGLDRRSAEDLCADPDNWCPIKHDGPCPYRMDSGSSPKGTSPVLPQWRPFCTLQ